MKTVLLTVRLRLDTDTDEEASKIIEDLDYNFSCIKVDCPDGTNLIENDRVVTQKIIEQEIID